MPVPCRRDCELACPTYEWASYLLDDASDFDGGARLGLLISWGRIPLREWAQALAFVEDVYGAAEVLDGLRWLADHHLSATYTADHRTRVQALLSRYQMAAA